MVDDARVAHHAGVGNVQLQIVGVSRRLDAGERHFAVVRAGQVPERIDREEFTAHRADLAAVERNMDEARELGVDPVDLRKSFTGLWAVSEG